MVKPVGLFAIFAIPLLCSSVGGLVRFGARPLAHRQAIQQHKISAASTGSSPRPSVSKFIVAPLSRLLALRTLPPLCRASATIQAGGNDGLHCSPSSSSSSPFPVFCSVLCCCPPGLCCSFLRSSSSLLRASLGGMTFAAALSNARAAKTARLVAGCMCFHRRGRYELHRFLRDPSSTLPLHAQHTLSFHFKLVAQALLLAGVGGSKRRSRLDPDPMREGSIRAASGSIDDATAALIAVTTELRSVPV